MDEVLLAILRRIIWRANVQIKAGNKKQPNEVVSNESFYQVESVQEVSSNALNFTIGNLTSTP